MTFLEAFIIAVIEGLTEFLPVSSTGHMIIASGLLGLEATDFVKLFTVAIQFGAILSVVALYYKRFFRSLGFYRKLFIAFVPCAIAGVLLGDWIDAQLENVQGVAVALFVGGIVLLFVDKIFTVSDKQHDHEITNTNAFIIGLFQCLALFPGVSRSAATIIGGLAQKLSRQAAAEFSFFLAVPTMFAATAKKLYDFGKAGLEMTQNQVALLVFGNVIAFLVAILAIRTFISLLNRVGFKWFGVYRIILGGLLLVLIAFGVKPAVL